MSDCTEGTTSMSEIWAIIVVIIIILVVYAYISSKLSDRKKQKLRAETLPECTDSLKVGVSYKIFLTRGENFKNVEILGSIEGEEAELTFANWKGMFVLKNESGKKIFIKKSSICFIEEV